MDSTTTNVDTSTLLVTDTEMDNQDGKDATSATTSNSTAAADDLKAIKEDETAETPAPTIKSDDDIVAPPEEMEAKSAAETCSLTKTVEKDLDAGLIEATEKEEEEAAATTKTRRAKKQSTSAKKVAAQPKTRVSTRSKKISNKCEQKWNSMYYQLINYKNLYGNCNASAISKDYYQLGTWVVEQRRAKRKGTLTEERFKKLDGLAFTWEYHSGTWDKMFQQLLSYKKKNGDCLVPNAYKKNVKLSAWVHTQRWQYNANVLSSDRVTKLNNVGFAWSVRKERETDQWGKMHEQLVAYHEIHGNCLVPTVYKANPSLGIWVRNQRISKRNGSLTEERTKKLNDLEFKWYVGVGQNQKKGPRPKKKQVEESDDDDGEEEKDVTDDTNDSPTATKTATRRTARKRKAPSNFSPTCSANVKKRKPTTTTKRNTTATATKPSRKMTKLEQMIASKKSTKKGTNPSGDIETTFLDLTEGKGGDGNSNAAIDEETTALDEGIDTTGVTLDTNVISSNPPSQNNDNDDANTEARVERVEQAAKALASFVS